MSHVLNNVSWTTLNNGEDVTSNSISSTGSRTSCRVAKPCRNDEAILRALQDEENLTLKEEVKDDSFIVKVVYEDEKKARELEIEDNLTKTTMSMEEFSNSGWFPALT